MYTKVFIWFQPLSSWAGTLSWSKAWKSFIHSQLLQGEVLYTLCAVCAKTSFFTSFFLQAYLCGYAQFWTFCTYVLWLKQKKGKKRWVFLVTFVDNPVFPFTSLTSLTKQGLSFIFCISDIQATYKAEFQFKKFHFDGWKDLVCLMFKLLSIQKEE